MSQYLVAGGDALFKKRTSFFLTSRKSKSLLGMDRPLTSYPQIPDSEYMQRLACLAVLIGNAEAWISSKQEKIDAGKASRRYPAVKAVLDEARDEMKAVRISERAQANWGKLRDATNKIIPQGSVANSSNTTIKHLTVQSSVGTGGMRDFHGENNWLEVLDDEHHRGHEISKYFKTWAANPSETRSFWEYLESVNMTPKEESDFKKVTVKYVEDLAIRTLFELDFEGGKIYSRMNPLLQTRILGTTNMSRRTAFELAGEPLPLTTTSWPSALHNVGSGWAAYVMSTSNVVYAGVHVSGVFHHSSFLAGAPVLAAGMIKVEDGTLREVHEKNGHYQAKEEQLIGFLRFLQSKLPGLNMATLPVHRFSGGTDMAAAIMGQTASKNSRAARMLS